MRCLYGADHYDSGKIFFHGQERPIHSVQDALAAGIGLIPEDRRAQALALGMDVAHNINMADMRGVSRLGIIQFSKYRSRSKMFMSKLKIKAYSDKQIVQTLSGGNQQKVVISKVLSTASDILIMDEPTIGIDIGAKTRNLPACWKPSPRWTFCHFYQLIFARTNGCCRQSNRISRGTTNEGIVRRGPPSNAVFKNRGVDFILCVRISRRDWWVTMNHNPLRGRPHLPSISTELAISILVVCFYVVFSLITPTFSSEYNLINLLKQASVKGIVTIAVTFVFIAGQCDLTVGASTALSAMICALFLMSDHGWSPWSAIAVSVLCTLLVGVINGFIVYELKVVPFIATLGMSSVIRGLIKYMCNARTIADLPPSFNNFAILKLGKLPLMVCVWVFVVVLAYLVLRYTVFGRNLYTIEAARPLLLSAESMCENTYTSHTCSVRFYAPLQELL